jgi:hypothetical protein
LDTNTHFHIEERIEAGGPFSGWQQVPQLPGVIENRNDALDLAVQYINLSRTIYNAELSGGLRMLFPADVTEEFPYEEVVMVEQLTNPETGERMQVRVIRCDAPKVLYNETTGEVRSLDCEDINPLDLILQALLGGKGLENVIVLGPGSDLSDLKVA